MLTLHKAEIFSLLIHLEEQASFQSTQRLAVLAYARLQMFVPAASYLLKTKYREISGKVYSWLREIVNQKLIMEELFKIDICCAELMILLVSVRVH